MSKNHISRPPNYFILYRAERFKQLREAGVTENLAAIVKAEWKNLDKGVEESYRQRAEDIQKKHKTDHPNWKYLPRTQEQIALDKEQAKADRLARRSARAGAHPYANAQRQRTSRASSSSSSSSSSTASTAQTFHSMDSNAGSPLLSPLSSVYSSHGATEECFPNVQTRPNEVEDIYQRLLELNANPYITGPATWNTYIGYGINPMEFLHPTDRETVDLSRFNPAQLPDEVQLEIACFSAEYVEPLLRSHGMYGQLYPDDEELADAFAYPRIF